MKLLRAMSVCSLLLSSIATHAMTFTKADMERSDHQAEEKKQWEAAHPGQVYQQGCDPVRKLKPGYVWDPVTHKAVLAATVKQTNSAADECTPIKK